jgi:hypothetical protein
MCRRNPCGPGITAPAIPGKLDEAYRGLLRSDVGDYLCGSVAGTVVDHNDLMLAQIILLDN